MYENNILLDGKALKPEFIEKAQEIMKQEPIDVGTVDNWKKTINL